VEELEQGTASPRTDLLALMLTTPNEEGIVMSDDAIKDNLTHMLFAGHDTSSITMAMVLKYLSLNPECLTKVVQGESPFCRNIHSFAFKSTLKKLNWHAGVVGMQNNERSPRTRAMHRWTGTTQGR
jgi:cytochrome P450